MIIPSNEDKFVVIILLVVIWLITYRFEIVEYVDNSEEEVIPVANKLIVVIPDTFIFVTVAPVTFIFAKLLFIL